jgi:7-cyano-7-deazaguanine synthase
MYFDSISTTQQEIKMTDKKALVLLSGGLDSATVLAIAKSKGFTCLALTCLYGQRHKCEIESARNIARHLGTVKHKIIKVNLQDIGGSALLDDNIDVPEDREDLDNTEDIPVTYVPARNMIFLSYAVAWAEVEGISDIFIGVNSTDYSGYPDCRQGFIRSFEQTANLGTAKGVSGDKYRINTPIINMSKAEIIKTGTRLGVDYSLTHSCYAPDEQGRSCGKCDSCRLRLKGFRQAGLKDKIEYVK